MATAQHTSALAGSVLLQHSIGPAVGLLLMYLSVHCQLLSTLLWLVGLFGSVCGSSILSFSWFVSLSILLVLLVQYLSVLMSTLVVVNLAFAVVVPVVLCA